MLGWRKKPKAMRVNEIMPQWFRLQKSERIVDEAEVAKAQKLSDDPVQFFSQIVGFEPTSYQREFIKLFLENQFIAARWCRQSGKSWIVSALLLWYAVTHPDSYIGIVGPSWRQAKLIIRRVSYFLRNLPPGMAFKPLKTVVRFTNGSAIEAFPNNPETIRGPTLHVVYCVPSYVKVTLSNGTFVPICDLKPGEQVLTYNKFKGRIEVKKVINVFANPLSKRRIIQVFHEFGHFDCTAEHKVFTLNRGYVPAIYLTSKDKILYLADIRKYIESLQNVSKSAVQPGAYVAPRATYIRQFIGRPVRSKAENSAHGDQFTNKSFLKTSRIRSIQILNSEELCENSTTSNKKQRLGERTYSFSNVVASSIYRNLFSMLQRWKKDYFSRVVKKNRSPVSFSSLVYGRWFPFKVSRSIQYSQIFQARKFAASTMVEKSVGSRPKNRGGFEGQRILYTASRQRQRSILRVGQAPYSFLNAIQNFARVKASSMCGVRQTSFTQKSGPFSRKENCLLESGMQKNLSKIGQRLEAQRAKSLRYLWKSLHTDTRQDKDMLIYLSENLPTSTKKTSEIKKQEVITPSALPAMRHTFRSQEWTPENLRYGVSHRTAQKILESITIPKALHMLRGNFSSTAGKTEILQRKVPGARALSQKKEEEEIVCDLEVEDNHNFFADGVLVSNCDEFAFFPNDEEIYDAILFTLGTTNGKFVCSSTPWNRDSVFYKIFYHRDFEDFAKHHVAWRQALEPQGPLKKAILEKIRKQFADDAWRWKREMEAEWAEDENVWLAQSLITKCIGSELELWDFESLHKGKFLAGLDLGKHQDYSAFVVVEGVEDRYLLRHVKVWPLETKYATVIGYVKTLTDRWKSFENITVDVSGVGEYIVEDMNNSGIRNVEGVTFTSQRKQELASIIKQRMLNESFRFPYVDIYVSPTKRLSYVAELNVERFELMKDGSIKLSHPQNQHDDIFWASCLSLYSASKIEQAIKPTLARAW